MRELIEFPNLEQALASLDELVKKANELAKNSENVWIDCPHVKQRMLQRNVTTRQIFDVLRNGKGLSGPTLDKYGDWRIKLKRYSAGRVVQVVVVVKESQLEVVTVI
jgi:hypothetical protein